MNKQKVINGIILLLTMIIILAGCNKQAQLDQENIEELSTEVTALYHENKLDLSENLVEGDFKTIQISLEEVAARELTTDNRTLLSTIYEEFELAYEVFLLEKQILEFFIEVDRIDQEQLSAFKDDVEKFKKLHVFYDRQQSILTEVEAALAKQIADDEHAKKTKESIAHFFHKDGHVHDDVTREAYDRAKKLVAKVADQTLKESLEADLKRVDEKLIAIAKAEKEAEEQRVAKMAEEQESAEKMRAEKMTAKETTAKADIAKTTAKTQTKSNTDPPKDTPSQTAESKSPAKETEQTAKNVVEKMNNLGNSRQVILVTTKDYNATSGTLQTFEKQADGTWAEKISTTAHIGKNGFSDNKVEGDGKSPTGKYTLGTAFGYQGNPGTKLAFKASTNDDVWVDDSNSKYYNTWQQDNKQDKDWESAESMMHRLYNYGIVINYNTSGTPKKGSAIFLHVGNSHTLGCVAINQSQLVDVMKWVDPSKNPVIIQTPEAGLGKY